MNPSAEYVTYSVGKKGPQRTSLTDCPPSPQQQLTADLLLKQIHERLECLETSTVDLDTQLDPILKPAEPQALGQHESTNESPLVNELVRIRDRIQQQIFRIQSIEERNQL